MGKTLIEGVGNYLIVSHPRLGNFVIVSTRSGRAARAVPKRQCQSKWTAICVAAWANSRHSHNNMHPEIER